MRLELIALNNIKIVRACKELQKYYNSLYEVKNYEGFQGEIYLEFSDEKYEKLEDYLEFNDKKYLQEQPMKLIKKNLAYKMTDDTYEYSLDYEYSEFMQFIKFLEELNNSLKLEKIDLSMFKMVDTIILIEEVDILFGKIDLLYNVLKIKLYDYNGILSGNLDIRVNHFHESKMSKDNRKKFYDFYNLLLLAKESGVIFLI